MIDQSPSPHPPVSDPIWHRQPGPRLAERDHELRAALFGLEASAALLSNHRGQLSSTQVGELTAGMVAESRRARAVLNGGNCPPGTFDLGDVIRPVVACARASGLDVALFVRPGVEVEGRRDSTAQVLVALLDNVRAHAGSPAVDVLVAVLDDEVAVYVEDRGNGIPAPLRRRVFERGVTGDGSAGSGLGLHIAQRLMAGQGGSISVRDRRGGGTSFVLRLRRPRP